MTTEQKHLEIKTYVRHDIGVRVRIDYDKGQISLLNAAGEAKSYVFAGRSIDYMKGWVDILDSMKSAIELASKELRLHQAMDEELQEKHVAKVMDVVIKSIAKKRK